MILPSTVDAVVYAEAQRLHRTECAAHCKFGIAQPPWTDSWVSYARTVLGLEEAA